MGLEIVFLLRQFSGRFEVFGIFYASGLGRYALRLQASCWYDFVRLLNRLSGFLALLLPLCFDRDLMVLEWFPGYVWF